MLFRSYLFLSLEKRPSRNENSIAGQMNDDHLLSRGSCVKNLNWFAVVLDVSIRFQVFFLFQRKPDVCGLPLKFKEIYFFNLRFVGFCYRVVSSHLITFAFAVSPPSRTKIKYFSHADIYNIMISYLVIKQTRH